MATFNAPLTLIVLNLWEGASCPDRIVCPAAFSNMIISCPSCATCYDLSDHAAAPDGSVVRCGCCGHAWIEARAIEVVAAPVVRQVPTVIEQEPDHAPEIQRLMDAAREAREGFSARRSARRRRQFKWMGFAVAAVLPLTLAGLRPDAVVKAMPGAATVYAALGMDVNIYGLVVRRVEMQHLEVDGTVVLAVKGEIANVSGSDRKIPSIRFGLREPGGKLVYDWTLDSGTRPLRPGESTNFVTRVATPPESAKNLEIRFARADEIGSIRAP